MIRISVITPQPTPYRDPFWNTVAEQPGVELDVFYCYAKGEDRPWEIDWPFRFRAEVLPGRAWLGQHNGYWNPSILKRLRATRYDAIILGGYNHLTMLAAAWYAKRHKIPYFVMCESFHGLTRPRYRSFIKRPLVRWIVSNASGILPTGKLAREYLVSYGGRDDRCVCVPNSPDLDWFREQSAQLWPQRETIRRELGLSERPTIIFVGRLIYKKGVDLLLEAVAKVFHRTACDLIIAGDGPERRQLEELSRRLDIHQWVKFVGFRQPMELPRWYCAADLFVLPARSEPFGVVVMEALACGLPVVVTSLVGCYPDVINNDRVGRVVPPRDPASLADALLAFLRDLPARGEVHSLWEPVYERMRHAAVASELVTLIDVILKEKELSEESVRP